VGGNRAGFHVPPPPPRDTLTPTRTDTHGAPHGSPGIPSPPSSNVKSEGSAVRLVPAALLLKPAWPPSPNAPPPRHLPPPTTSTHHPPPTTSTSTRHHPPPPPPPTTSTHHLHHDLRARARPSFCTERSGHYDAFDQGLIFFLPNMTWGQPPFYVHQMVKDTWQPWAVSVTGSLPNINQAVSAATSADGSELTVRLVNLGGAVVRVGSSVWGGGGAASCPALPSSPPHSTGSCSPPPTTHTQTLLLSAHPLPSVPRGHGGGHEGIGHHRHHDVLL
jgi:hypothetical protein